MSTPEAAPYRPRGRHSRSIPICAPVRVSSASRAWVNSCTPAAFCTSATGSCSDRGARPSVGEGAGPASPGSPGVAGVRAPVQEEAGVHVPMLVVAGSDAAAAAMRLDRSSCGWEAGASAVMSAEAGRVLDTGPGAVSPGELCGTPETKAAPMPPDAKDIGPEPTPTIELAYALAPTPFTGPDEAPIVTRAAAPYAVAASIMPPSSSAELGSPAVA
eukprot:scaffold16490_cov99-Isochrysis_galbana.AAC.3